MTFTAELRKLLDGATEGVEGAGLDLRDYLEDNAAALLELVDAAEKSDAEYDCDCQMCASEGRTKVRQALAKLNGEKT